MEGQLSRDAARAERGVARLLGQGQRSREAQGEISRCAAGGAREHVTTRERRGKGGESVAARGAGPAAT